MSVSKNDCGDASNFPYRSRCRKFALVTSRQTYRERRIFNIHHLLWFQLTAQVGAMQIGTGSYISPTYQYYTSPIIHAVPVADSEHTSNAASPEDPYQTYPPPPK